MFCGVIAVNRCRSRAQETCADIAQDMHDECGVESKRCVLLAYPVAEICEDDPLWILWDQDFAAVCDSHM